MKSRMLGNPLVRFCEGWGGNREEVPHLLDRNKEEWLVQATDYRKLNQPFLDCCALSGLRGLRPPVRAFQRNGDIT